MQTILIRIVISLLTAFVIYVGVAVFLIIIGKPGETTTDSPTISL